MAPRAAGSLRPVRRLVVCVCAAVGSAGLFATTGCGGDARLARQEAVVRARTCASLTERHDNAPVTVPATRWFLVRSAERADTQPSAKARSDDNNAELHHDCERAKHHFVFS